MKEQDHTRYLMQLDEIGAFLPQLLRSNEIAPARCECTASARYIESVEAGKTIDDYVYGPDR